MSRNKGKLTEKDKETIRNIMRKNWNCENMTDEELDKDIQENSFICTRSNLQEKENV